MSDSPISWSVWARFGAAGIIFICGLTALSRWRKPALLLTAAALLYTGQVVYWLNLEYVISVIQERGHMRFDEATNVTGLLNSVLSTVPFVLLLRAVFCQRRPGAELRVES